MKRRSCSSENDWNKHDENISDFLKYVPLKRTKVKVSKLKSTERNGRNSSLLTDEDNISWIASDDENSKHEDGFKSPVIADCKHFLSSGGQCIKSTPAGSPILSQNNLISEKILVSRRRRLSLVPLSPITPGVHGDFSFPNSSHFSFSIHEDSRTEAPSSDHTPLALPLPDSDEDTHVGDYERSFSTSANQTATQDEIDSIPTQVTSASDSPHISNIDAFIQTNEADNETMCAADVTTDTISKAKGSEWLENVMGKFDSDGQAGEFFKTSTMPSSLCYDSAKKLKFVRNGVAVRLKRVLKQEQTQKVLFKHQLKELQQVEHTQPCIKLKVVSHHKDGQLHVLECKVLSKDKLSGEKKGFCTVILNNEIVIENNLDLMSVFTIHPPWKEMHVEQHGFPLLVCVYHIVVHSDGNLSAATSQAEGGSQEDVAVDSLNNNWTRNCESLLESLEKQNADCGLCLVATVQRLYQQSTSSGIRKTWLCEDTFGVFFELTLESSLSDDVTWSQLIEHGEGQRIYFQKIFVTGRTTRDRSPGLFSLIDSVWDSDGFGLLQVQNSQSQQMCDSESQHLVQAPSFCYRFTARRWQSACFSSSVLNCDDVSKEFSELNRPRLNGSAHTDVLYRPCETVRCLDAKKLTTVPSQRHSLFGFVLQVHCNESDPFCDVSFSTPSLVQSKQVYLVDNSVTAISDVVSVIVGSPHTSTDITAGDIILVKDALYEQSEGFRTDFFSKLVVFSQSSISEDYFIISEHLPSHLYPALPSCLLISDVKLASFPQLKKDQEPDRFARVGGIICGFTSPVTDTNLASSRDNDLPDKESGKVEDYSFEVLLMLSLNVKVKLKILRNTAERLMAKHKLSPCGTISAVNGKNFSPVNCYVYAKYVKTHLTLFYAEETTAIFLKDNTVNSTSMG